METTYLDSTASVREWAERELAILTNPGQMDIAEAYLRDTWESIETGGVASWRSKISQTEGLQEFLTKWPSLGDNDPTIEGTITLLRAVISDTNRIEAAERYADKVREPISGLLELKDTEFVSVEQLARSCCVSYYKSQAFRKAVQRERDTVNRGKASKWGIRPDDHKPNDDDRENSPAWTYRVGAYSQIAAKYK